MDKGPEVAIKSLKDSGKFAGQRLNKKLKMPVQSITTNNLQTQELGSEGSRFVMKQTVHNNFLKLRRTLYLSKKWSRIRKE